MKTSQNLSDINGRTLIERQWFFFGALIRDRSLSSANNIPEVRDKSNLRIDQILGAPGTILLYDTAISYKKGSSNKILKCFIFMLSTPSSLLTLLSSGRLSALKAETMQRILGTNLIIETLKTNLKG